MKPFTYEKAASPAEAAAAVARQPDAKFIAGGTNLLDLMKLQIEAPTHLVDVNGLALDKIEATPEGGLRIGALVRNTALAADERVRRDYGVLSRALLAGASGQLRNKATTAGNLLQRTRCPTSTTPTSPATSAGPAAAAARSAASAGSWRWWAAAMPASRRIPATWRWPCACSTHRWKPSSPMAAGA
jgi:xanthine dehydrogenase YagS FAD-binding subunit